MLTIIMETCNNEAELAQTLSVLVAGAVEGLVSDVIILDGGSKDGSGDIADAAGAKFLTQWDLKEVIQSARGAWFLLLQPGACPTGRWIDDVADYLSLGRSPARFSASRLYRRPLLRRFRVRRDPLELGFLISRQQALQVVKPGMSLSQVARMRPLRRLACELVPAWVMVGNHAETRYR